MASPGRTIPAAHPPARRERRAAPQAMGEIIRENVFAPYRERLLYPVAAVAALVLLPLSLGHLLDGNRPIAALLLALVAMLAVDVVATSRGRRPPIPFAVVLLPAAAAVIIALAAYGLAGALWSFPTAMLSYFVLRRRTANVACASLLLVGSVLLYLFHGVGTALRFCASLGLVLVTVNILLEVLESAHAKLLAQSVTDASTGAYNRRHLETCVEHMLERHARTRATGTVLLLDLDRFAAVNDRLGVEGGDRVLRAFAGLVRANLGPQDLVFRSGGQRFVVLLPDTPLAQGLQSAERLRRVVAQANLAAGQPLTVSIGASELRDGDDAAAWLARAGQALRHAKDEGRDRVMAEPPAQAPAENPTGAGIAFVR